jgi:hypothetical protein
MNVAINIGVGRVDRRRYNVELPPLSGPKGDCRTMENIVSRIADVARPVPLMDEDATASRVLGALSSAARSTNQGLVIVSFSGHGFPSVNGDNSRQGWCLHDRILTESEIKAAVLAFGKGVHVLVVADCCYAMPEESWFDMARRRLGFGRPGVSDVAKCVPRKDWKAVSESPAAPSILAGPAVVTLNFKCAVMWFAACKSNQKAYDGRINSLFTGALEEVVSREEALSYDDLCVRIAGSIRRRQTPECRLLTSGETGGGWDTDARSFH